MNEATPTELLVRRVGEMQLSPMGHPYVEAEVDGGVVTFWGSPGNMSHIDAVRGAQTPFAIICDCIPSNWQQHDLWIYERHEIYAIDSIHEPSSGSSQQLTASANGSSSVETSRIVLLFCKRCKHRRDLNAEQRQALLVKHGIKATLSIPTSELPRLRCEHCGAHAVRQTLRRTDVASAKANVKQPSRFETCPACGAMAALEIHVGNAGVAVLSTKT